MSNKKRVRKILGRLRKTYKITGPFVNWSNNLELLIGTVLSAQCTDKRVNIVTKHLFSKYKTAQDYASADLKTLEQEVYSTGFYKNKAKNIKKIGEILVSRHGGRVPSDLNCLLELPGVSHKTAYLVLAKGYGINVGVSVDTHVKRLAFRLGLTEEPKNTDKISRDLGDILDSSDDYLAINEYFITHGRAVCVSTPKCNECVLRDICPKRGL